MTEVQRDDRATPPADRVPDGSGEQPRDSDGQVVYETGGLRLAFLIAGTLAIGFLFNWWYVATILGIGLMIFLHELGHYLTARWSGMKVTQFFLGFGPRIWSFYRGETEYGIKALPVGAYVRIIGMNNLDPVEPADEAVSFRQQSFPKRMLVMCAGSMAHFIQAFVLLVILLGVVGVPGGTLTRNADEWTIAKVTAGSAAARAGLQKGDRIVALDGTPVSHWAAITEAIPEHNVGDTIDMAVERDGDTVVKAIRLGARPEDLEGQAGGTAFLGVGVKPRPVEKLGIGGAILAVPGETARFVNQSAHALAGVFTPAGIGDMTSNVTNAQADRAAVTSGSAPSAEQSDREQHRLISIFGVIQLGGSLSAENGVAFLLLLFFQMNIFIGIFNMLPLPPLDGGHAAVAIYERARSRKGRRYYADASKLLPITYAVVMGLAVLFVATTYLDLVNPING
jgi:membrane-associated protease RseP (regulator of RpoE activity)